MERDRGNVIFDLLRERIGQPSEPTHRHAHGEVLTLDIARANVLGIGIAGDPLAVAADAFGGAVALLSCARFGVLLDEHREIDGDPAAFSS